jgi:hypothetical protein
MDPIVTVVIPGFLGGLLIVLLINRFHRPPPAAGPPDQSATATDTINMSRIRVSGVGGLGLVAMALVVAWFVPRIGQTLLVGVTFGVFLAAILIMRRRRVDPLPSSGRRTGANTTLSIDHPFCSKDNDKHQPPTRTVRHVAPTGHAV